MYIPDVEKAGARSDSTVKQKNGSQINNNISSAIPKKFMSSVCSAFCEAARTSWTKSGLTLSYDAEQDSDKTYKMPKACLECECFTAAVRFWVSYCILLQDRRETYTLKRKAGTGACAINK